MNSVSAISNTAKVRDAHTCRITITGETTMQDPHWKLKNITHQRKIWSPGWPDAGICAPLTTPKLIYVSSSKNVHAPPLTPSAAVGNVSLNRDSVEDIPGSARLSENHPTTNSS